MKRTEQTRANSSSTTSTSHLTPSSRPNYHRTTITTTSTQKRRSSYCPSVARSLARSVVAWPLTTTAHTHTDRHNRKTLPRHHLVPLHHFFTQRHNTHLLFLGPHSPPPPHHRQRQKQIHRHRIQRRRIRLRTNLPRKAAACNCKHERKRERVRGTKKKFERETLGGITFHYCKRSREGWRKWARVA